ncbi:mevalonate kinase family protein [Salinisphaera aquimarina]|uniref:Mevalonate kinase n=1 Tax=Salinisphaera aquimarina TaxID=2094031 RepID=A0ABV7ET90_9GAMM
MPFPIHVSAPGKLFLIGEYAVLDGAPALLTAVDRRVQVTITRSPDERWHMSAVNLGLVDIALERDGALPAGTDAATATGLKVFDAVRQTLAAQFETPLPALSITIDSSDFARDGYKLGLGSSAAVAAALTQALAVAADLALSRAHTAALAISAHRRAQDGAGSGGDVAAAVYGGVIGYTRDQAPVPLTWPDSLAGMAVVTGTGASTSDMVARVNAYRERDPNGHAADIARLAWLADTAQHALTRTGRFLQLAKEYFEALIALDHHAHAGIVGPRHQILHALAARHNAVFKTSGAGGGDVGLAFARRGADEQTLRSALENAGAHVLPLTFGAPGVRIENALPVR